MSINVLRIDYRDYDSFKKARKMATTLIKGGESKEGKKLKAMYKGEIQKLKEDNKAKYKNIQNIDEVIEAFIISSEMRKNFHGTDKIKRNVDTEMSDLTDFLNRQANNKSTNKDKDTMATYYENMTKLEKEEEMKRKEEEMKKKEEEMKKKEEENKKKEEVTKKKTGGPKKNPEKKPDDPEANTPSVENGISSQPPIAPPADTSGSDVKGPREGTVIKKPDVKTKQPAGNGDGTVVGSDGSGDNEATQTKFVTTNVGGPSVISDTSTGAPVTATNPSDGPGTDASDTVQGVDRNDKPIDNGDNRSPITSGTGAYLSGTPGGAGAPSGDTDAGTDEKGIEVKGEEEEIKTPLKEEKEEELLPEKEPEKEPGGTVTTGGNGESPAGETEQPAVDTPPAGDGSDTGSDDDMKKVKKKKKGKKKGSNYRRGEYKKEFEEFNKERFNKAQEESRKEYEKSDGYDSLDDILYGTEEESIEESKKETTKGSRDNVQEKKRKRRKEETIASKDIDINGNKDLGLGPFFGDNKEHDGTNVENTGNTEGDGSNKATQTETITNPTGNGPSSITPDASGASGTNVGASDTDGGSGEGGNNKETQIDATNPTTVNITDQPAPFEGVEGSAVGSNNGTENGTSKIIGTNPDNGPSNISDTGAPGDTSADTNEKGTEAKEKEGEIEKTPLEEKKEEAELKNKRSETFTKILEKNNIKNFIPRRYIIPIKEDLEKKRIDDFAFKAIHLTNELVKTPSYETLINVISEEYKDHIDDLNNVIKTYIAKDEKRKFETGEAYKSRDVAFEMAHLQQHLDTYVKFQGVKKGEVAFENEEEQRMYNFVKEIKATENRGREPEPKGRDTYNSRVVEEEARRQQEIERQRREAEAERKRQQEEERKRKEEEENMKKIDEEEKKREEERKRKEEEEKKISHAKPEEIRESDSALSNSDKVDTSPTKDSITYNSSTLNEDNPDKPLDPDNPDKWQDFSYLKSIEEKKEITKNLRKRSNELKENNKKIQEIEKKENKKSYPSEEKDNERETSEYKIKDMYTISNKNEFKDYMDFMVADPKTLSEEDQKKLEDEKAEHFEKVAEILYGDDEERFNKSNGENCKKKVPLAHKEMVKKRLAEKGINSMEDLYKAAGMPYPLEGKEVGKERKEGKEGPEKVNKKFRDVTGEAISASSLFNPPGNTLGCVKEGTGPARPVTSGPYPPPLISQNSNPEINKSEKQNNVISTAQQGVTVATLNEAQQTKSANNTVSAVFTGKSTKQGRDIWDRGRGGGVRGTS
jgi:hypothetical protein